MSVSNPLGIDFTGGTTIFEETTASFSMQDGVVSNDDLRMKLSLIEATGEGKIGLGQQNIDYLFTPIAAQARDGRGLALPVVDPVAQPFGGEAAVGGKAGAVFFPNLGSLCPVFFSGQVGGVGRLLTPLF